MSVYYFLMKFPPIHIESGNKSKVSCLFLSTLELIYCNLYPSKQQHLCFTYAINCELDRSSDEVAQLSQFSVLVSQVWAEERLSSFLAVQVESGWDFCLSSFLPMHPKCISARNCVNVIYVPPGIFKAGCLQLKKMLRDVCQTNGVRSLYLWGDFQLVVAFLFVLMILFFFPCRSNFNTELLVWKCICFMWCWDYLYVYYPRKDSPNFKCYWKLEEETDCSI